MVKKQKENNTKKDAGKGIGADDKRARKINASTVFETCKEQLSPLGGLLGLIKIFDLIEFEEVFKNQYIEPSRKTKLGNYRMLVGMLMLLFIGFNRLSDSKIQDLLQWESDKDMMDWLDSL